jgi:hypothetical protein
VARGADLSVASTSISCCNTNCTTLRISRPLGSVVFFNIAARVMRQARQPRLRLPLSHARADAFIEAPTRI